VGAGLVVLLAALWTALVHAGAAEDKLSAAAWPIKAGDEAEPDRVAAHFHDNRNACGRCLCRKRRRGRGCGNHGHLTMNQIRR